jgi:hypothetical protein
MPHLYIQSAIPSYEVVPMIRPMTCVLALTTCFVVQAAGAADPKSDSLGSFEFDGLKIGATTLDQFKAKYRADSLGPRCASNENESDESNGVASVIVIRIPHCDGIVCDFLDGTLYKIDVLYYDRTVEKMGGVVSMVNALNTRFGLEPKLEQITTRSHEKGTMHTWNSAGGGRRAEFNIIPTVTRLEVVDTRAEARLNDRRAKNINLGF